MTYYNMSTDLLESMLENSEKRQYLMEGRTFLIQWMSMDTRTDSDLMASYAEARDEDAFAELVARHQRMVYRVCLRMLRHHQGAEDATQAVCVLSATVRDGIFPWQSVKGSNAAL